MNKYKFIQDKVTTLKESGVYRTLPVLKGPNTSSIEIDDQILVNMSANNYLGLANDSRLKKAAIEAIEKYGVGCGAVRTIIGNFEIHEQLELALADFKHTEKAFVFQSGYDGNIGVLQALFEKGDLIISDELNHASIIDGIRMSKADKLIYKHSDMDDLAQLLDKHRKNYQNVLIITDGVFSMDGDLCRLKEIVALAQKYQCLTYVDDAHGSGVMGPNGRGTVAHFGLCDQVDFVLGTLSKAIGVKGGYLACSKVAYEWLLHRARPILFSTNLSPADAAASLKAIEILKSDDSQIKKLWTNADYFKQGLKKLGFNLKASETPITPVIIGDEALSVLFSKKLKQYGVLGSPIIFPTVPKGMGRIRCMVSASHSQIELDKAIKAFELAGKELKII